MYKVGLRALRDATSLSPAMTASCTESTCEDNQFQECSLERHDYASYDPSPTIKPWCALLLIKYVTNRRIANVQGKYSPQQHGSGASRSRECYGREGRSKGIDRRHENFRRLCKGQWRI
eukprot:Pompholyxophrys_punicea_v1_NODE_2_length_10808_cov_35.677950.p9 type:complete len:119 gc:universal NODE_2_length_10808_cov_35.677950:3188-3544(+)